MAKTLKNFLEGYLKGKSADEQKFIDKHVTAKNPDRNGNGDEVFKGKTKAIDRRKERHGYNPGEDEKVYEALKGNQHKIDKNHNGKIDAQDFKLLKKKKVAEEAEQIDELSDTTLDNYKEKASGEIRDAEANDDTQHYNKRVKGYTSALKAGQRNNKKTTKEEVELDEKLTAKTPMGTYIKDFKKSDAPQFKGKSPAKRRVMAIAAKLTAERGGKPLNKEERLHARLGDLSETHKRTLTNIFEKLNEDNKSKFLEACDTPEGIEQMLDFAINHRGE